MVVSTARLFDRLAAASLAATGKPTPTEVSLEASRSALELECTSLRAEASAARVLHGHDLAALQKLVEEHRETYLRLLLRSITGFLHQDPPLRDEKHKGFDPEAREYGQDWPSVAHSMIGLKRMQNVRDLTESVMGNRVPGDLIETGVWRGGACIFMRGILRTYGVTDRIVWVADSFAGLPPPNEEQYPADKGDTFHTYRELAVSLAEVKANFERYELLDDQVRFLEGWFKDTLPNAPIEKLAILRLDGDMYESTTDALKALYPKLSVGGYAIIDDYNVVAGCRQAVSDYRTAHAIEDPIQEIDGVGVFWRRTK